MSRTWKISLAWLCLPLLAWLGLTIYSTGMMPVGMLIKQQSWSVLALYTMLVACGHAVLMTWPVTRLYGRAAGFVSFVLVWPVIWQFLPMVLRGPNLESQGFWALALTLYVVSFLLMVQWMKLRRRVGDAAKPSPELLIRRHIQRIRRGRKARQSSDMMA